MPARASRRENRVHRPPAVPRGHRPVRPELVTLALEQLWWGRLLQPVRQRPAFADAVVVNGPDVQAPELEDQEHLSRPAPDTADLDQPGHELVVGQPIEVMDGDRTVADLLREVSDRSDLRAAHAGGSHRTLGKGEHGSRGEGAGEELQKA